MTQYNSLNVKLSNSQLNKFKSAIKNETEVVLRLSSNMTGDNETNFPHQLLLTYRQVAGIHKKILGSGNPSSFRNNTVLIIWNGEMGNIIKIVKPLEDSGLLVEGVTETVQNEVKEQKGRFLSMLLGTIGASLLRNLLTRKGMYKAGKGKGINRAGEGIVRVGYGSKMDF